MYQASLEFPDGVGGGLGEKIPSLEEVWISSGNTQFKSQVKLFSYFDWLILMIYRGTDV